MTSENVRVVGICGSLRVKSYTRMALQVALSGAQDTGAEIRLINLHEYDLPFCDGREQEESYGDEVARLRSEVSQAHGLILATPEYHGGVSGALKNALDLMSFREFGGKMIGLVGVSGGSLGALHALNSLRVVGRSLHAWVVPQQAVIAQAWKAFDAHGNLLDVNQQGRLRDVGRQVARFAYLHSSERAQEFLREWETAPVNPGG